MFVSQSLANARENTEHLRQPFFFFFFSISYSHSRSNSPCTRSNVFIENGITHSAKLIGKLEKFNETFCNSYYNGSVLDGK